MKEKRLKRGFYKVRNFRISDETFEWLQDEYLKSGVSWNLFFRRMLKEYRGREGPEGTKK